MHLKPVLKPVCESAAAAMLLIVTSIHAATPAIVGGGFTAEQPPSFIGTRGWSFNNFAPEGGILIGQLGIFDSGSDGLVNSHQIGLWATDGTLLASTTIPAGTGTPLFDGYRYAPIAPVFLPSGLGPGGGYIIAAQYAAADADDLVTPAPAGLASSIFPWSAGVRSFGCFGYGEDLPYPDLRTVPLSEGSLGRVFWEPNFQFEIVPEPSVWLLASAGVLVLFWRLRRQKLADRGKARE